MRSNAAHDYGLKVNVNEPLTELSDCLILFKAVVQRQASFDHAMKRVGRFLRNRQAFDYAMKLPSALSQFQNSNATVLTAHREAVFVLGKLHDSDAS